MLHSLVLFLRGLFQEQFWMVQIFIVIFVTLCIYAVQFYVFKKIANRAVKTRTYWDDALLKAINVPLGVLIWLLGICYAATVSSTDTSDSQFLGFILELRKIGSLFLIAWFTLRFIREIEKSHISHSESKGKKIDRTLIHAVAQLLTIAVLIIASLIGMQIFGVPISGLLAFGGIGGAGIAFASKDLLANFFGGFVLYLDRPFKVGDWIKSPDRSIEGVVEYIGWRLTRIRTFDKRPLYVPNGIFLTIAVENPSRMTNRRINTNIGLRYQDAPKVDVIIKDVDSMLRKHPEIDTTQTLFVNLVEFGSSSLNFTVYVFTKTTDWLKFQAIQQDIYLKIIDIIQEHGAECAFPTQTLFLQKE